MNKILVIYHRADFDGIFCREIAKKFLGDTAQYVGWDYGDSDAIVPPGVETIYMLDISVEAWMNDPRLIWIDHHKSAIEKYSFRDGRRREKPGCQIDGVAACRLAWQFFFYSAPVPGKQDFIDRRVSEPLAVRLAGEYDIWDKRDPNAELFQHGLRSKELTEWDWRMLLDDSVDSALQGTGMESTNSELAVTHLLQSGRVLQYAKTQENESIIKASGFTIQFEGLTFLACNHARYNSFLFTAGLKPEHDACFGFCWRDGQWTVSLYHAPGKEQHDLSKIAVKYGGGGHRGACGFRIKKLPFLE